MPDPDAPSVPSLVSRRGKKIVIFADGTGSSFSQQESNVWRLYQTLDKTEHSGSLRQLARYIPGVGTSGNSVLRLIDGVTGIGVPSNVRKLYRFLCWNWEEGDEIYLFGFSRGAFTVRTLGAMVAMQGLMPRDVDGKRVSSEEMSRNAMGAWRAYRTLTAPLVVGEVSKWNPLNWQMNPLIEVTRMLRDGVVLIKRRLFRQSLHAEVVARLSKDRHAGKVPIRFMGLFDTVEAYGMPVEEMRRVWNWLIWPIQFRNHRCSFVVQKVRHALSLDEERKSFDPIRFDLRPRPDGKPVPETQEAWFAGVHSDVGGGYPNDETAYEPLLWIANEAARQELIFDNEALNRYRKRLYPQALIHDSRKGLASFFRYAPRVVEVGDEFGGAPVVHHSALEKIRSGADGYAPLGLPDEFLVYPANGTGWAGLQPAKLKRDPEAFAEVMRLIGRRKATNWLTIGLVLVLVGMPVWDWVYASRVEPNGVVRWLAWVIGGVVPSWAVTWVETLCARWWISLPVLLALWWVYSFNQSMARRIKDCAGQLWQAPE
jgi:uncharacterized protein (DUF2235 family)